MNKIITFQEMQRRLNQFWAERGCLMHQGYDLEMGAGTFNPATFLRCLGPEPYKAAYIEPSRRPSDGRYGQIPNRTQHYFQYQVMLKPSPLDIQDLCLASFEAIGFNLKEHDIRFVHDDWESPTLGAWGLGWEVWMDGMEVLQFTYFQACGGQELTPVTGELTYGLERLATYLQKVDSIFELKYNDDLTYGDVYFRNEVEWSHYNFDEASVEMWQRHFQDYEKEAMRLLSLDLPIPAYDFVIKSSHAFNLLDARGAISVTERAGYIGRIRNLAKEVAVRYLASREKLGFPLLKYASPSQVLPTPPLTETILEKEGFEDFLLEIGSEEIPALFVPIGLSNLEKGIKQLLENYKIPFLSIETFGTPRRLTALVKHLACQKPAESIEKKGPWVDAAFDQNGQLSVQGKGFFQANGLQEDSLESLRAGKIKGLHLVKVKDREQLVVLVEKPQISTAKILQEELPKLITSLDFPKKMRWSDLTISYARPLRWIVALLGHETIPFAVGDVLSSNESAGHRQLSNIRFQINSPSTYLEQLKEHFVIANQNERKASILQQLRELELELNGRAVGQDKVIQQVLNLTEWPLLTAAPFDEAFLKAPKEVLISEMIEHQKYFPIEDHNGQLKNMFIITANNTPSNEIRSGNQKVLSARLKDGVFLFEQDLKTPLDHFNYKLQTVTFQKDLGSVWDKVLRLEQMAVQIQHTLQISSQEKVLKAAHYAKADLTSNMIYEFPELQGMMGKIYAERAGFDLDVASAIDEHWMPRSETAPLPQTETGIVVSLAEKFDNLISYYSVGLKPTSSSDPYALRRQVLGIIKILIHHNLSLPLDRFIKDPEILQFIQQRIKTVFQDFDFQKDEIEASLSSGTNDIYDTYRRTDALHRFRKTRSEFKGLIEVYKRAKGQLALVKTHNAELNQDLLKEPAEQALSETLEKLKPEFAKALQEKNYDKAYELTASLQPPLARLFDEVKILDENEAVKENRLVMLNQVFSLFGQLLDFDKLQK